MNEYEFGKNYGKELEKNLSKMKELDKKLSSKYDELEEEFDNIYDSLLRSYDEAIVNAVFDIHQDTKEQELIDVALRNYDRTGTEPQFIIYAMEDYIRKVENLI